MHLVLLQYVFFILSSIITTLSTLTMRPLWLKVRNAQPEQIIKQVAQLANSLFVQHSRTNRVCVQRDVIQTSSTATSILSKASLESSNNQQENQHQAKADQRLLENEDEEVYRFQHQLTTNNEIRDYDSLPINLQRLQILPLQYCSTLAKIVNNF